MPYVANARAKVIHRNPANESCNLDDMEDRMPMSSTEVQMTLRGHGGWRLCTRCFSRAEREQFQRSFQSAR